MTGPDEWVQAAQAADQEYARLPLSQRERGGWQRVPDRQVLRLLEAAVPRIAAAERDRIAAMLREYADAMLREYADGEQGMRAVVLREIADLLDGAR